MRNNLFMKIYNRMKRKSNNEGSSLVLVIIAIAFVGMLVAMSSYMSYYNYLMKVTDKESKRTFYTAEEALAEINAGLQTVVSNSMAVAYTEALQNNTGAEMSLRDAKFQLKYESELLKGVKGVDNFHYDVNLLKSYLVNTAYDSSTDVGAVLIIDSGKNTIFKKDGGLVLQNIKLKYTNENGYVTILSTDIFLKRPVINLSIKTGVPELENCSIITNEKLEVTGNNNLRISGNVYGGKDGILASNDTRVKFQKKDTDLDTVSYRLVAGGVNVENSYGSSLNTLEVSDNYELWTEDVNVDSGRAAFMGASFVRDDLTISGKNSKVTLAGDYFGYGDELYKSKGSSAILVNGANTTLDFSRLNNLMLAGHAYIGARHYDANLEGNSDYVEDPDAEQNPANPPVAQPPKQYKENDKDLMLGESLSVKSNQLMYLVPVECMGYYHGTTEQYLPKNPITYDEYLTLTNTYQYVIDPATGEPQKDWSGNPVYKLDANNNRIPTYTEVNLNVIAKKVGKNIAALGATYKPVFRRINGTVLVYYYLDFTSDKATNEFFAEYYEADKENMDAYIKTYIRQFTMNPALRSDRANLHLAGNIVRFDRGDVSLVKETSMQDANISEDLADNRAKWLDSYTAYSKKMISSTSLLSAEQLFNDIYDNLIISEAEFTSIVPLGTVATFVNGETKALAINNKGDTTPYRLTRDRLTNVSVIIASGDLEIDSNYSGLIICGGTVAVTPNCNFVESDSVGVRKAMYAEYNGKKTADLLLDGSVYLIGSSETQTGNGGAVDETEQQVARDEKYQDISELVLYENWSKQ